ncbi:MAG: response regulator, partial [Deltaproteobacteria bacterium]|nr:response regulator [Deltaproteobacteria bacterium]
MRILVVEDNDIVRALIAKELKSGGYEIFEAKNGLSALELIPDIQPHLITMDVEMPQMNGFDTCFKIRTEIQPNLSLSQNQLPIIFITSNDTLEDRAKGFQVGVSDFITKPFLKGEVLKTVNKLLRQESALKGLVTLVVEDNDMSRHLLNNILQSEGIVTLLAANGVEALKIFQTKESEIDLVLTDFLMPQMNGEELCQKIRNEFGNRTTPIIFLSAMSERDSILEMFKAGASDYVIKPFAKEELVARIRVHLESRVLNKKLFEQVQELKHLNKLKDEFLTVTSHDLKSPLNGILGFTRIMLDEVVPPELQTEYLGHIRSSGEFLLSMINDILTLSQIQAQNENFEQIPVSLDEIALSSVQTIKHMANPKGIQINYKLIGKEKPSVSCNNNDLTQIFNNLL